MPKRPTPSIQGGRPPRTLYSARFWGEDVCNLQEVRTVCTCRIPTSYIYRRVGRTIIWYPPAPPGRSTSLVHVQNSWFTVAHSSACGPSRGIIRRHATVVLRRLSRSDSKLYVSRSRIGLPTLPARLHASTPAQNACTISSSRPGDSRGSPAKMHDQRARCPGRWRRPNPGPNSPTPYASRSCIMIKMLIALALSVKLRVTVSYHAA